MTMHSHSLSAYRAGGVSIGQRAQDVLAAIHRLGAATDREVMIALKFTDMNAVRPRITDLIKAGRLEESGSCEDTLTGRQVRVIRIPMAPLPATPVAPISYTQTSML